MTGIMQRIFGERLTFIERDGVPVPETDPLKWSRWMVGERSAVAHTRIGDTTVSTIFLGTPHVGGMYETMVFPPDGSPLTYRYESRADAERGHGIIVAEVKRRGGIE